MYYWNVEDPRTEFTTTRTQNMPLASMLHSSHVCGNMSSWHVNVRRGASLSFDGVKISKDTRSAQWVPGKNSGLRENMILGARLHIRQLRTWSCFYAYYTTWIMDIDNIDPFATELLQISINAKRRRSRRYKLEVFDVP